MIAQDFFNFLQSYTFLGVDLSTILLVIVITAVAIVLEILITRYLIRFAEDIFALRPQVAGEVFKRWDMERQKNEAVEHACSAATKIKHQHFAFYMIQKDKVGYAVFPKIRIIWIAYLSVPF